MVHKKRKSSGWIANWAKCAFLYLMLPCLGVYAEPSSGTVHWEYSGPWQWTESNLKTVQTATGYKQTCEAAIKGYTGSSTDITIPKTITMHTTVTDNGNVLVSWEYEATVTSIGSSAFDASKNSRYRNLTSVTIPASVTNIGDSAFYNCSGLTGVTIPDSVTSIGYSAFSGCSGLMSVTIPNSVTSIRNMAFDGCSGLMSVTIPNSVTSIGNMAFDGCSGLKSVTVPQYVLDCYFQHKYSSTLSGSGVSGLFSSSRGSITNVSYSSIITNIGESAFSGCSSLTSVMIPNSVTSIGRSAFDGCSGLMSVTIPDSVTNIGAAAFSYCSGLTSVTIPDSVTSGISAFAFCSGLTSVKIGNGVTSIGGSAFYGCSSLTSVTIPNSVTNIEYYAFRECSSLTSMTIPDSVASISSDAFFYCININSVSVPQSVMSLRLMSVFSGSYRKLRSLHLGQNVTAIDVNEFRDCIALTNVTVADGNTSYVVSEDGCLYDIVRNLLLFCPRDKASIEIPSGVTTIGNYAFQYCTNLVSVSMPETIRKIGTYSFAGCEKISGVTIPNDVQTLSTTAFDGCDVLWTEWYRAIANLSISGGGSSGGGSAEPVDPRYALAASPADRAIASVTVDRDCAIDSFVLKDGKVYDCVVRVVNTSASEVRLTLPAGYVYETFKGAKPLTIPANSRNILTITRTTGDTFLVSREELETVQ